MRQGQQSIYGSGEVVITGDVPPPVQIILGRNGRSIRGRVQSSGDRALFDTTVVLVPESSLRGNALLYRIAIPSDSGAFELKTVAPGNYKLFAWNGVLLTAWLNAEFLQRYEDRGIPVRVEQKELSDIVLPVLDSSTR